MGETLTFIGAFTAIFGMMDDVMGFFMEEPTVYFVAIAAFGALAGVSKKFIPMRKR